MRRTDSLAGILATFFCVALSVSTVSAQTARPTSTYAVCVSEEDKTTVYFSAVFGGSRPDDAGRWSDAFTDFITTKYKYDGVALCFPQTSQGAAQNFLKSRTTALRNSNNRTVVETGWVYSSTAAKAASTGARGSTARFDPKTMASDPRLAKLSQKDRARALEDAEMAKPHCEGNEVLSGLFDCVCFAKMVFDYRIEHRASQEPLGVLASGKNLDCTKCIESARFLKWVKADVSARNYSAKQSDCSAQRFLTLFKATPYPGAIKGLINVALKDCADKPSGPRVAGGE